jgi:hypothetical protein
MSTHHRISVTVTDPHSEYVTQRKEKQQKFLRLPISDKHPESDTIGAVNYAKQHYRKIGYKVHDATHTGMIGSIVKESEEISEAKSDTIEAHGIRGIKRTPWRRSFKHVDALNAWCEKNDADCHGTRDLESAKKGKLAPAIKESEEISEADEQLHFKNVMNKIPAHKRESARKAYTTARKNGHTHAAALSNMHTMFSESEEVNELSYETLDNYSKKAPEKAAKLSAEGEKARSMKMSYKKFRDATMTLASKSQADKKKHQKQWAGLTK